MGKKEEITLFGGDDGWKASDWTASDDRVRGGKSQSFLEVTAASSARFYGNLDIQTLGGAGFASQRTASDQSTWDLSDYDGIRLELGKGDGKRYTFILKDELLPRNPDNGREQASISYEYDFELDESSLVESTFVFISWGKLTPTYRGKEKKDAKKLNTKSVKRFSIMMRSFFGDQEGDFSLAIKTIKAVSLPEDEEKGFTKAKSDSLPKSSRSDRSRYARGWMPVALLSLMAATYGLCLLLYPSLRPGTFMHSMHRCST